MIILPKTSITLTDKFKNFKMTITEPVFKNDYQSRMQIFSVTQVCLCNLTLKIILGKLENTWVNKNYSTIFDEFHLHI